MIRAISAKPGEGMSYPEQQFYVLRPAQGKLPQILSPFGSLAEVIERASLWRSYGWHVEVMPL